nr:DUF5313 domain-containing protein [Rhodococcus pyridinivorans]
MQDWVRNDILGPGGVRRYLLRWNVPVIPLLLLFLLIPGRDCKNNGVTLKGDAPP